MKLKRLLAIGLAAVMIFGGAPIAGIAGLTGRLSGLSLTANAAHVWQTGDLGILGSYPQTKVTDSATLTALNALSLTWISYGYYSNNVQGNYMKYADATYHGEKYRAVKFTAYRPEAASLQSSGSNSLQDDNGYYTDTTYWFKYEPLWWRVLDPASGLVMCEKIIDSQTYYNTLTFAAWADSTVRTWLNNDFWNTAFTETERSYILSSTVSTPDYKGIHGGASTTDKLFLLSREEVMTAAYGFNTSYSVKDTARKTQGSDYAKCQGLFTNRTTGEAYNYCGWWLRSPGANSFEKSYADEFGVIGDEGAVSATFVGVRPAFEISDLSYLALEPTVPISVTGVSVDKESLDLFVGDVSQLKATVTPSNAWNKDIIWTSSNKSAATVDSTGLVTAVGNGTTTITATAYDQINGLITDTCLVTVSPVTLTSIIVRTLPSKTDYFYGDTLDTTNLTLTAFYNNKSSQPILSGFECSPTKFNQFGTQTIVVTYGGKSCIFGVTVNRVDADNFTVADIPDQALTGQAVTPLPTVSYGGKTLTLNTDYIVSYSDNINVGTATVTITGRGNFTGATSATFIIVPRALNGITLGEATLSLRYKGTAKLNVIFNPADATNKKITWASSDPTVVAVDANGKVTAVSNGTATITATSEEGGHTAACTVTVTYVWWQWLIKIMLFGWMWY